MFKPKYAISSKLMENIKRVAVLIADLNNKSFPDAVYFEFEKEAKEMSSFSSTSIEGNPLPLTEVKRVLKSKLVNIRDTEQEIINYNQAIEELLSLYGIKKKKLDLSTINRTHKLVTKKLLTSNNSGILRKDPVFVNNPRTGKTVYLPPDQSDVKGLMKDLLEFIKRSENKVDPLIIAGIFHKQFVIIHPYIDGNGRVARLITTLLLSKIGLNAFKLFSFENYYNKNVTRYFKKVGVLGNYYDVKGEIDFTSWLEYFTDGIIDELLRVSKELSAKSLTPDSTLHIYHVKIVDYIKRHGYINDKLYSKITDRAKATRALDFKKLIELGIIEKHGKGRATYYKLV